MEGWGRPRAAGVQVKSATEDDEAAIEVLRRKQAFFAPRVTQLNETLVEARKMARAEEAARDRECRAAVHALHAIIVERTVRARVRSGGYARPLTLAATSRA